MRENMAELKKFSIVGVLKILSSYFSIYLDSFRTRRD